MKTLIICAAGLCGAGAVSGVISMHSTPEAVKVETVPVESLQMPVEYIYFDEPMQIRAYKSENF